MITGPELTRSVSQTLGATLDTMAGVNSTYYGPGASRPVIRGLGGDRIRILQSGVGTLDASNVSPDHNTAIEPLFAARIEVLRGPATLLYGSSAMGGVVNVIDNRIPEQAPAAPFIGVVEARGGGAADETSGVIATAAGNSRVAVQVNALHQRTGDLHIPGVARIDAGAPADQPVGRVPNTDLDTSSGSAGVSWFGGAGRVGAAVSTFDTDYGVPIDEPISISMRQHRLDLSGELTRPFGVFTGARGRFGVADYEHSEVSNHRDVNTTFDNKAWEGRLELPHTLLDGVTGNLGMQAERSNFSAAGEEVVTPPSITTRRALFALEQWKRGRLAVQVGGRIERQSVRLGNVSEDLPEVPGYAASSGEKLQATARSASVGIVYHPRDDWSVGLSLAHTERLPTAQELFSNGPHGGTGAWELGAAGLGREKSLGVELSLRRRAGVVTGAVSAFASRFSGFIFEQRLAADAIPEEVNEEGLIPYQFTAKDAEFLGAEAELVWHVLDLPNHAVHLQLTSDFVRAEQTTDHEPLPRIPPFRLGGMLRYEGVHWRGGIGPRWVAAQDRVAEGETRTPGYALLDADVSYVFRLRTTTCEVFARGNNLTNREARVHTSFLKEYLPLPGRGVLLGLRVAF